MEQLLQERKKQITDEIKQLSKKLSSATAGKLICCHQGKYTKWYHSNQGQMNYIPKKKHALAEKLAIKKYASLRIQDLQAETRAIDTYLKVAARNKRAEHLLLDPGYNELLQPLFKAKEAELDAWSKEDFQCLNSFPENLIHESISGHFLRSKSESMIDTLLFRNHIPFRYECVLDLDGFIMYPDFTIRHPKTGETIYWEHFGMIDIEDYQTAYHRKIHHYIDHHIYPSINLICTYETADHPLTMSQIQQQIDMYLLN